MYATYTLNKDELNYEFLDNLKKMFDDGNIYLTVESYDESEYLMKSKKNHEILLNSIENVEKEKNLITIPIEEIERLIHETDNIRS